ncbi:GAF domain-containing sensor histidine kinase [Pedobacter foliorum]|uniref:GAF domain-containing sensor histidine kinase n=1 Tax=Pedobacter foliorum TaxID=2739058 RepID=UPI001563780F|nr:GAF domain-containing sensor histidine kinase [Pedobacter foliorum]NRF39576.1 GAF domain-containing sensor histidine kinase [Pedobacter foliorum]
MKVAPLPKNESDRLSALASYKLMDSDQEQDYDDLAMLAAEICQTPVALITFIGEERQWFKSRYGTELTENHRDYTFCSHAILDDQEIMIVSDATKDSRFFDNPMVTEHKVVFYAGVPLVNPEGYALGSICVIGNEKKQLNDNQISALKILGRQALQLIELRKKVFEYEELNKALEVSNGLVRKFAERVAHDIKNPLGNIMLTAQALRSKAEKAGHVDYYRFIDISLNSARKLLDYVNQLLQDSKTQVGVGEEKERFFLTNLLEEILGMLTIPDHYELDLPIDAEICSSRIALEQILLNLLSNAVRYNDKVKPEIELSFEQTIEGYHFIVRDNGIGIPLDVQHRIFEHGYCSGLSDRFSNIGNGIGLGTVKSQVERLNGSIKVESIEGVGSSFFLFLPK